MSRRKLFESCIVKSVLVTTFFLLFFSIFPVMPQPTQASTPEEVAGFWSVELRASLKVEGQMAPYQGKWLATEQTTGFFEFNTATMGFDLRADNWRTDRLLFGKFALSATDGKIILGLDPSVPGMIESTIRSWVEQLAAGRGITIAGTQIAFLKPAIQEVKDWGSASYGPICAWKTTFNGFVTASMGGRNSKMPFTLELLTSCGNRFTPGSRGTLGLPRNITNLDVKIQTPEGPLDRNPDGTFALPSVPPGPCLVAATVNGIPVAFSFFEPYKISNSMSCKETAVSLVMLSDMLFTVPSSLIPNTLALIRTVPEVPVLAGVICQGLSVQADFLIVPSQNFSQALSDAVRAVNSALKTLPAGSSASR